jgi:putative ABC transport system permease protein
MILSARYGTSRDSATAATALTSSSTTLRDVLLLIARQGVVPAFAGFGLGTLMSAGLTGLLRQMLYGISPYDPFVFGSSIVAIGVIAMLAAAVSGHRACRVDASSILK